MDVEEGLLIKGGEAVVRINIHRSPAAGRWGVGYLLTVWVHSAIEDFFRSLSNGEIQEVNSLGRHWLATDKQTVLTCYHMSKSLGNLPMHGGYFNLDRPGQPLSDAGEGGLKGILVTVNLSPLRLCGASDGAGVTFGVKGVYTLDALIQTRDKLLEASEKFYITYLKPMDLSMTLSTQNIEVNQITSQMNRG